MIPFDYQDKAIKSCLPLLKDGKNTLLYSPTGSGKTVMGGHVIKQFKPKKSVFLVNKQPLVGQAYKEFAALGLKPAVLHNEIRYTVDGELMSADIQRSRVIITLLETFENTGLDFNFDLITLDEAHKSTSKTYQNFRDRYPKAIKFGLTATPWRIKNDEGEHLNEWYDEFVSTCSVRELINKGRLAQPIYYAKTQEDHVVETWLNIVGDDSNRRTVVLTLDTRHSLAVLDAFERFGLKAKIITQGTELEDVKDDPRATPQTPLQRNRILKAFKDGEVDVLVSAGALAEGFDEPLAKYCFICRNISTVSFYHQIIGRVLRIHPTKREGVIVDFNSNFDKFGPIEDWVWDLNGEGEKGNVVCNNGGKVSFSAFRNKKLYVKCDNCAHVYDVQADSICGHCGTHNSVTTEIYVSDCYEYLHKQVNQAQWEKLNNPYFFAAKNNKDKLKMLLEVINRAQKTDILKWKFNQQFFELFDENGIIKQYSWISTMLKLKTLRMEDKIQFDIV